MSRFSSRVGQVLCPSPVPAVLGWWCGAPLLRRLFLLLAFCLPCNLVFVSLGWVQCGAVLASLWSVPSVSGVFFYVLLGGCPSQADAACLSLFFWRSGLVSHFLMGVGRCPALCRNSRIQQILHTAGDITFRVHTRQSENTGYLLLFWLQENKLRKHRSLLNLFFRLMITR